MRLTICGFFFGGGVVGVGEGDTFPGADRGISLKFLVSWMHLECLGPHLLPVAP